MYFLYIKIKFLLNFHKLGKNFNGTKYKWTSNETYIKWYHEWLDLCVKKQNLEAFLEGDKVS